MELINVILTSALSVISLFIITKIMGHKQISQLDFFDYICGITIGSIGAELATELEAPWKQLVALIIYGLISVFLSFLTHKFPKTRKIINGTPTILMNDGKLYRKNLKKAKLDLSEFLLLCREEGYFDLGEIKAAIYEHNGKISVLPNSENKPLTPSDVNIQVKKTSIGTEIIMDGQIMGENLKRLGRDENWLKKKLLEQGFKNEKEIFLGIYRSEEDALSLYPIS